MRRGTAEAFLTKTGPSCSKWHFMTDILREDEWHLLPCYLYMDIGILIPHDQISSVLEKDFRKVKTLNGEDAGGNTLISGVVLG